MSESHDQNQAEIRFAEDLATFLKTCFVYPENNIRVRDALATCLKNIRELGRPGTPLSVKVAGQRLVSCGAVRLKDAERVLSDTKELHSALKAA